MKKTEFLEILEKQLDLLYESSKKIDAAYRLHDISHTAVEVAKTMYSLESSNSMHQTVTKKLEKQLQLLYEFSEKHPMADELPNISFAIKVIIEAILGF